MAHGCKFASRGREGMFKFPYGHPCHDQRVDVNSREFGNFESSDEEDINNVGTDSVNRHCHFRFGGGGPGGCGHGRHGFGHFGLLHGGHHGCHHSGHHGGHHGGHHDHKDHHGGRLDHEHHHGNVPSGHHGDHHADHDGGHHKDHHHGHNHGHHHEGHHHCHHEGHHHSHHEGHHEGHHHGEHGHRHRSHCMKERNSNCRPSCRKEEKCCRNIIDPVRTLIGVKEGKFTVRIPLDGNAKPEDLKLSVKDGYLVVEIKMEKTSEDGSSQLSQVFTKKIQLPEKVKVDDLTSNLSAEGVLMIEAPVPVPQDITVPVEKENTLDAPAKEN